MMARRASRVAAGAAGAATLLVAGCGGSGGPVSVPSVRATPNISALLAEPVAKPRVCPSNRNGTTSGRASPWVGTVDVSVFLDRSDSPATVRAVGTQLRAEPIVARLYFESRREAYEEFQRLYTCSARVRPGSLPASYRIVLRPGTTVAQRNALVAQLQRRRGVSLVSCDPSNPCVDVVRSVDPSITARPGTHR